MTFPLLHIDQPLSWDLGLLGQVYDLFRVRSPDLKLLLQIYVYLGLENHKASVYGLIVEPLCLKP